MTQSELSKTSGIQRKNLIHFENDYDKPSLEKCNRLAKSLNISPSYLYDDYLLYIADNPGSKIRCKRKSLKLTQKQLANILNTSTTTIKRWKNDVSIISRQCFDKLKIHHII